MLIAIKRIYEKPSITDGKRVLVDRLWPRGVKKGTANIDLWLKDIAPSNELRQWYNHSPQKWDAFRKRYRKELDSSNKLDQFIDLINKNDVTILFAASDTKHNNAVALVEFIRGRIKAV
ncbi:MAG: DUF488 domain-containing protein [Candidatus Marsarchaeota archaeon]|nr:DUF488 domain-containing protein [Candidatus Marsarchaeota archaeon]MCL5412947.1 DUF488 domain-containing protein [Candidatus Marsarchaeota archaeon]